MVINSPFIILYKSFNLAHAKDISLLKACKKDAKQFENNVGNCKKQR